MAKGKSSHGGAREGAGRKPKYESGSETESVRVPKPIKEDVRRMLLLIDELVASGFSIEQIEELLNDTFKR